MKRLIDYFSNLQPKLPEDSDERQDVIQKRLLTVVAILGWALWIFTEIAERG